MDSMDWFDPASDEAVHQVIALNKVLRPSGRVLFRSAARRPWYTTLFQESGFDVKCIARRDPGKCIDRVNMYASTWICTKTSTFGEAPSPHTLTKVGIASTLEELHI